jgi:hypothetical protein
VSEGAFHVHGEHEHAVEHHAHAPGLGQTVAIFTAVLSTIGAILSYQGGLTQVEAMLLKNEAVLKKTQASDQWNFYQAKSGKAHLMEIAADLAPPKKATAYRAQAQRYDQEKKEVKKEAEALDREFLAANEKSERLMAPHHKLAQGMTLIQIAISLASITVLTRRRWLLGVAGAAAVGGTVLWLTTLFAG